jgi:Kef-type K+ transport system membrane component KefB
MEVFSAAPSHDVLKLVIQIGVLLLSARALGEIAQRMGQPSVVGELLAGIILGPSLLSGFLPVFGYWIVPETQIQGYLLEVVSMIGAMFLLLITGLETDVQLIKRHARTAIGVSFGGILITFSSGFVLGQFLPDFLVANTDQRLVFELFVAVSMSISSIPVIAKVLMDMNLMRRDIGQTIIAAGMSDDTTGWILLSIVAGLASGQMVTLGSVLQIVGSIIAFMLVSFTLGRWLVKKLLRFVQDEVKMHDSLLTLVVVMMFLWGAITTALHFEAILGAFVMGIIFGTMPRLPESTIHKLESIALGIFAPIFFGVAGLKVNIIKLIGPNLLLITAIVILIASLGKVVGTYAGARLIGRKDHWSALGFGAGLNARGAMEIIIAMIGLRLGILSQDMYSIIVVMAMATSMAAPSALRWVLKHTQSDEEEEKRLKKESMEAQSLVADIHRILLPVRPRIKDYQGDAGSARHRVESKVLELLGQDSNISITLMSVANQEHRKVSKAYLNELRNLFTDIEVETKVVVRADSAADAILDEARKNYDLLVLGATEVNPEKPELFNSDIDDLVRMAPCPTIVVQAEHPGEDWRPNRVLVPTDGSQAAKNAAELSFYVSSSNSHETVIHHNAEKEADIAYHYRSRTGEYREQLGQSILGEYEKLTEAMNAKATNILTKERSTEQAILSIAEENDINLIILGTNIHPGADRLYLGRRVEHILYNAKCPVLVFNT